VHWIFKKICTTEMCCLLLLLNASCICLPLRCCCYITVVWCWWLQISNTACWSWFELGESKDKTGRSSREAQRLLLFSEGGPEQTSLCLGNTKRGIITSLQNCQVCLLAPV